MKLIISRLKIIPPQFITLLFILSISFSVFPKSKAEEYKKNLKNDSLDYSWEKFSVSLGGFISGLSTDILFGNEQVGLGIAINMEDALGLETTNLVFRGETEYNFGRRDRHQIGFGYFGFFRASTKVLESDIAISGQIFPIGSEVNSRYDLQIFKTAYQYSYFVDKRVKLGASLGLFIMPISFSVSSLGFSDKATSFTAPLPVLGLDANFAITPKLYIKQGIEVLYLQIAEFKGAITDINFRLEYTPWKHIGFGIGYDSYMLSIERDDPGNGLISFVGSIRSGYTGLLFYGKFQF